MNTISSMPELYSRIAELQELEASQLAALNEAVKDLKTSLSPAALAHSAIESVTDSKDLKTEAIKAGAAIGAGWIAKKLIFGRTNNFFSAITGNFIQHIVTGLFPAKAAK